MQQAMEKIHTMVDTNAVIGEPIVTSEGVTLIPISRLSFGFASGGGDRSAETKIGKVWGGSGAAVKMEPVGFLMIHDGIPRIINIQPPAVTTVDRLIDTMPEIMDKVEHYIQKYAAKPGTEEKTQD